MTQDELRDKLFFVLKKETGIDAATIDPDKDFRMQVNLDSMQFVAIVARLEHELDIEIPIDIMTVDTLNEFLDFVSKSVAEAA